jgi:hypothetical protein
MAEVAATEPCFEGRSQTVAARRRVAGAGTAGGVNHFPTLPCVALAARGRVGGDSVVLESLPGTFKRALQTLLRDVGDALLLESRFRNATGHVACGGALAPPCASPLAPCPSPGLLSLAWDIEDAFDTVTVRVCSPQHWSAHLVGRALREELLRAGWAGLFKIAAEHDDRDYAVCVAIDVSGAHSGWKEPCTAERPQWRPERHTGEP